jgi:hypothetical protein
MPTAAKILNQATPVPKQEPKGKVMELPPVLSEKEKEFLNLLSDIFVGIVMEDNKPA